MERLLVLVALISLTGCASLKDVSERHPYVTGFVATSLVLCAGGALRHRDHDEPLKQIGISLPCRTQPDGSCR